MDRDTGVGGAPRRGRAWLPSPLVVLALLVWACGDDAGPAPPEPPTELPTLSLRLRVHVLSSEIGVLDATSSDARVREALERVNRIWAQAGIMWELDGIVREATTDDEAFAQALDGQRPFTDDVLVAILPRKHLTGTDWDAFLVRDLAAAVGFPGTYLAQVPAALSSEVDPAGLDDPGRILAHELGHSLTLPHVPCTAEGNLMAPGCAGADRGRLTAGQVQQARAQASTGRPAR